MIDINNISGYNIDDSGFELLRQVAQKYCPEEWQSERRTVIPDEKLNLSALIGLYDTTVSSPAEQSVTTTLPQDNGFGIGIPESEKLRTLHYEEVDTLNSEEIKKDFPVLNQQVNGHHLVWLDNGATTQKPLQVIDKISDYYKTYNSNIHRGAHTLAARATDSY